jgi:pSer/pThr/pTyr-binding forkhead associated (FHA) protein
MDRVPLLVVIGGPLKGGRHQVTPTGLRIGRGEDCDITLPDTNVSRHHAEVLLHNSAVWVKDAGSRNGVFVNDKRVVRPKQMGPGDRLTLGEHVFTLELAHPLHVDSGSVSIVQRVVDEETVVEIQKRNVTIGITLVALAVIATLVLLLS